MGLVHWEDPEELGGLEFYSANKAQRVLEV